MTCLSVTAKVDWCPPIGPDIPILCLDRDECAVAKVDREYLLLNHGKVLDIPFGEIRGNGVGDFCRPRIHVVKIIAVASPNSVERLPTNAGNDSLRNEKVDQFRSLFWSRGTDSIAFTNEFLNSLGNRLCHHDGAKEVTVRVKVNALSRGLREVVAWDDTLVRDLKTTFDTFLDGLLELLAQGIVDHATPHQLWNVSHSIASLFAIAAIAAIIVRLPWRGSTAIASSCCDAIVKGWEQFADKKAGRIEAAQAAEATA